MPIISPEKFWIITQKNKLHSFIIFSKVQLVSRLPPLRYRFGLSDPPKAAAPRSVRCANYTCFACILAP